MIMSAEASTSTLTATPTGSTPRVSQRPSNRCIDCATKRIKCTKEIPCGPCVKRGCAATCRRETVIVHGRLVQGTNSESLPMDQQRSTSTPSESDPPLVTPDDAALYDADLSAVGLNVPAHGSPPRKRKRLALELEPAALTPASRFIDLIPFHRSNRIVSTSLDLLNMIHGAVHAPTYIREHPAWLASLTEGVEEVQYESLALYFAIIATGLFIMDTEAAAFVGFTAGEMATIPSVWFEAALQALDASDWMSNHTVEAVQCVSILTLASHAFGPSSRIFTLQATATFIAQSLRLHLIGPEPPDVAHPGLIQREIGRRLWMFLINQQRLSPSAQQRGAIFTGRGRAAPPANVDDEDLVEGVPLVSEPFATGTLMTNILAKNRIADVMHDFFVRFDNAASSQQQQSVAWETDTKLHHLLDDFPTLQPSSAPYPAFDLRCGTTFVRATWEGHLWAIIIPHRRLLVHRAFLSRSFRDAQDLPSRLICIESARAILAERQKPIPALFDKLWHVSADLISAGVILATVLAHTLPSPERTRLRQDVVDCLTFLPRRGVENGIITRGLLLLQQMLDQADHPPGAGSTPGESQVVAFDPFLLEGFEGEGGEELGYSYGFWSEGGGEEGYNPRNPALFEW